MQPTFSIPLHISNIHWVPISPVACIISATSPDKPGLLCVFIFLSAAATSSILMQSAGPSFTAADILWSYSFSSFIIVHGTPCTVYFFLLLLLQPFYVLWTLSRTTRMSQYQKGKTNLDFLEQDIVSGSGISWAICKSAVCTLPQMDNHARIPPCAPSMNL